jgi:hypothetical protein
MLVRITALMACFSMSALAQYQDAGSAEFVFLRNFISAQPAGMAGAGGSLESGLQSLGLNPSGIARSSSPIVETSLRSHFQSYNSGLISAAMPFSSGNVAAQIGYLDEGDAIAERDEFNTVTGRSLKPSAFMLTTSYAEPLGQRLAWGATMRWVHENLDVDQNSANGLDMDLGILLQPGSRRFTYGLSLTNLGTKLSGHTKNESEFGDMPLSANGSIKALLSSDGATASYLDIQKPIDNYAQVRLGLEQRLVTGFYLRGGLRTDSREILDFVETQFLDESKDHLASYAMRFSLGTTIALSNFNLTYAWQAWGVAGNVHFLTLSIDLGRPSSKEPSKEPEE